MAAAGVGAGQFSNVWTLAEAAARDPFHPGRFMELVWENTSGYLLAACLVSLAAVLLSWVYVVLPGPSGDGPDRRTRAGPTADRAGKASASAKSAARPATSANSATAASNAASADASDDASSRLGPPPPPPAEEDSMSPEDQPGGVPDLVDMAHHLPARVKQAELRHIRQTLQGDMTEEQRRREREVERDQMAAILELMQQNSDKFGKPSLDDMQAQLKLYM